MKCTRCGGYVIKERIFAGPDSWTATRCVHCGDVTDPVIEQNRAFSATLERKPEGIGIGHGMPRSLTGMISRGITG